MVDLNNSIYKIPGKIGSTTYDTWIARTQEKQKLNFDEAKKEIDRLIEIGELVPLGEI